MRRADRNGERRGSRGLVRRADRYGERKRGREREAAAGERVFSTGSVCSSSVNIGSRNN